MRAARLTREQAALAERHVPLARAIAWQYLRSHGGMDPDEVESDALLGLCFATVRFDAARGSRFATYARYRILGAISDGQRERDEAARSDRTAANELERARYELAAERGRFPTTIELSEATGIPETKIREIRVRFRRSRRALTVDLDALLEGQGVTVAETLADPDAHVEADVLSAETSTIILDYLPRLSPRQRMAITLYYWEDMTLQEIGEVLEVTQSRVSQILTAARERLAEMMAREHLDLAA